jgi:hypothetical protein
MSSLPIKLTMSMVNPKKHFLIKFQLPPRGKSIRTTTFEDANLMHDLTTGRSCTGILHLVNQTPAKSKHQKTVESTMYSLEFAATCIATKQIMDL